MPQIEGWEKQGKKEAYKNRLDEKNFIVLRIGRDVEWSRIYRQPVYTAWVDKWGKGLLSLEGIVEKDLDYPKTTTGLDFIGTIEGSQNTDKSKTKEIAVRWMRSHPGG